MGDNFQSRLKQRIGGGFQDRLKQRIASSSAPVDQEQWDAGIAAEANKLAAEDAALPQRGVTPESLDAEAAANATIDRAVGPVPQQAPEPSILSKIGETAKDGLRGLNAGLYLNGSDEVAAAGRAATGANFGQALAEERTANAQAENRSPWVFNATRTAGYVPGMLVGGATAVGRGAMALGQGVLGGALGSDSNDVKQTVADAAKGGTIALGTQTLANVGSKALNAFSNRARGVTPNVDSVPVKNTPHPQAELFPGDQPALFPAQTANQTPAQWSAPGLRGLADKAGTKEFWNQPAMSRITDRASEAVGGLIGLKHGHDPVSAAIGAGVGHVVAPVVSATARAVAPTALRAAAPVVNAAGNAAQTAGQTIGRAATGAGAVSNAATTQDSRGYLLSDAAISALRWDPKSLGPYQSQIANAYASKDPSAVGSLLSRLVQGDPKFRTTVLPGLQAKTKEQE